jgi:hypothetical protein
VEVRSDATGEFLLRAEVLTPDEFAQEQTGFWGARQD